MFQQLSIIINMVMSFSQFLAEFNMHNKESGIKANKTRIDQTINEMSYVFCINMLKLLCISYLIKQKYLNLRIYTIKISSKQILMNQNRRFTRSSGSRYKNSQRRLCKSKEQTQLKSKIDEIIAAKNYNHALSIINSLQHRSHWIQCKRAFILFQMGKTLRSLNAVRNALKIQRNKCTRCYSLLLEIIQKSRPQLHPFTRDIENTLKCDNLPKRIKTRFQILKSEIDQQVDQASVNQERFQRLTQYYQNKGLLFKKVEIVQIQQQYRVARAKFPIKPNQVIIFVPETQMITLQLAKSLEEVCKIAEEETRLKSPKHCMLSVFLLIHMEKGQQSPYYNYIQCLPKKLNNFPIYYPDDLLQQLSGTYFLTIIKKKKADIEEDYLQIISIIPELKGIITYQKFTWARMVVSSRIFGVIINQIKTDALVPIADMLNHKIPKMTSWYFSDEKKGFIVQNGTDQIPKGQEIFDSYGSKCNSRFLLNYGFIIPNNSFNQVVIKVKRMRNTKTNIPSVKLTTIINSDQFRSLMAYYRRTISQLNSRYSVHHDQQQSKSVNFISHENQCQTMKEQLREYKTTIRTDQKILRSLEPLPYNFRNCVEIRLGQKIILDFYIRMSKKMIDYFSRKRSKVDVTEYEAYIREIAPLLRPSSL